ncbi:MAG TPA: hypothetical protein DET40_20985 [Lentisphaeria bacterium]|nr:MAG: hypothetical protein A2X45_15605 [Lentisphaerae bacterium GWF2_50_93]HCE46028.1 hypothetical protein [Lentisphaeria bacterium]
MGSLDEIRNTRKFVEEAVLRKQESDRTKSGQDVSRSIKTAQARSKVLSKSSRPDIPFFLISNVAASYVLLLIASLFLFYSVYQNVFASDPNYTSWYVRQGDFKRAETFVNRFLSGSFMDQDCFMPEKAESLKKSAAGLIPPFNGVPASSVVVIGNDGNRCLVLKATCPKGAEAVIIYLTPSGKSFYVSGIEIDKKYAMNNVKAK